MVLCFHDDFIFVRRLKNDEFFLYFSYKTENKKSTRFDLILNGIFYLYTCVYKYSMQTQPHFYANSIILLKST